MIYIIGGFCLALAAVVIPLMLLPGMNVPAYPDINLACQVIFEEPATCRVGAQVAGYATSSALLVALVLAMAMTRRSGSPAPRGLAPWAYLAAPALVAIVVGAHIVAQLKQPFYLDRGVNITRESAYVSMENLVWPVLLQMMNSQRRLQGRFFCLSLLLPIVALSPFRAILVSLVIFGFVLPIGERWWDQVRAGRFAISGNVKYLLIALLAVASLGGLLYWQTRGRVEETGKFASAQEALTQRLAYPLFQAHFAAVVAAQIPVPTMGDELLGKIRVRRASNLNEFLYGLVHGTGTVGEMTSLYYGEAAAYSKSPPMIWIVVAPLLMVAVWLIFKRFGYETGTLLGVQIWRGSLGGLVPLVPALVLQLVAIVLLHGDPAGADSAEGTLGAEPCRS